MPCSCSSVEPLAWTRAVISFLLALILRSMPSSSVISSEASRRRVFPAMSRGLTPAIRARAWAADRNFFAPPGSSTRQQPAGPVDGLGPRPAQFVPPVGEQAQHHQVRADNRR